MSINLRAIKTEDDEFLFAVYASTRVEEMRLVDWHAAKKESFLRMQFKAQSSFYRENYPGAHFQIILMENKPVGRLYIHKREKEIRIIDISLLPEYRGQGIGTLLLNGIIEEGKQCALPVTIHVERFNPALHLYERLGFCLAEDKGVYILMEWKSAMLEQHAHAG